MVGNASSQICLFSTIKDSSHGFGIQFTAIATTVIGSLSCFGSTLGNALILYVLFKCHRLQIPSNILLSNLCMTDFITGVIVVPTISVRRITEAYGKGVCFIRVVGAYFSYLTIMVSIFTIGIISVDRYYAIMKPFIYQRTVSNKRHVMVIVLIWLVMGVYSSLPVLNILSGTNFFRIACTLMTLAIITFAVCYARISNVVVAHRRKVFPKEHKGPRKSTIARKLSAIKRISRHIAGTPYSDQIRLQIREYKRTSTIALVVFFAILCYGPLGVVFVLRGVMGDTFELVYLVDPWADLMIYLNSVINPVLYCLRARDIRLAVFRVLPANLARLFLSLNER